MTVLMFVAVFLLVFAMPTSGGPNMLFGLPVPPGFRSTEPARRALRFCLLLCAIPWVAGVLALIVFRSRLYAYASEVALVIAMVAGFVVENRRLKPYAVQPSLVREFDLGLPDRLPWFTWLGIPPLAMLAAIAVYLYSRRIPGVYRPLILAAEIDIWLFVLALAVWYGSRRNEPLRKPAIAMLLAWEWTVALSIGLSRPGLAAGITIPSLVLQIIPFPLVLSALAYAFRASKWPRLPPDPTPNECWKGGIVYHNPNDAALFVQRNDGFGFTFNSANLWSWAIIGGSLLVLTSMRRF